MKRDKRYGRALEYRVVWETNQNTKHMWNKCDQKCYQMCAPAGNVNTNIRIIWKHMHTCATYVKKMWRLGQARVSWCASWSEAWLVFAAVYSKRWMWHHFCNVYYAAFGDNGFTFVLLFTRVGERVFTLCCYLHDLVSVVSFVATIYLGPWSSNWKTHDEITINIHVCTCVHVCSHTSQIIHFIAYSNQVNDLLGVQKV